MNMKQIVGQINKHNFEVEDELLCSSFVIRKEHDSIYLFSPVNHKEKPYCRFTIYNGPLNGERWLAECLCGNNYKKTDCKSSARKGSLLPCSAHRNTCGLSREIKIHNNTIDKNGIGLIDYESNIGKTNVESRLTLMKRVIKDGATVGEFQCACGGKHTAILSKVQRGEITCCPLCHRANRVFLRLDNQTDSNSKEIVFPLFTGTRALDYINRQFSEMGIEPKVDKVKKCLVSMSKFFLKYRYGEKRIEKVTTKDIIYVTEAMVKDYISGNYRGDAFKMKRFAYVIKITLEDEKYVYVGQTFGDFQQRMKEHYQDAKRTNENDRPSRNLLQIIIKLIQLGFTQNMFLKSTQIERTKNAQVCIAVDTEDTEFEVINEKEKELIRDWSDDNEWKILNHNGGGSSQHANSRINETVDKAIIKLLIDNEKHTPSLSISALVRKHFNDDIFEPFDNIDGFKQTIRSKHKKLKRNKECKQHKRNFSRPPTPQLVRKLHKQIDSGHIVVNICKKFHLPEAQCRLIINNTQLRPLLTSDVIEPKSIDVDKLSAAFIHYSNETGAKLLTSHMHVKNGDKQFKYQVDKAFLQYQLLICREKFLMENEKQLISGFNKWASSLLSFTPAYINNVISELQLHSRNDSDTL
jgi:hypothetical protein